MHALKSGRVLCHDARLNIYYICYIKINGTVVDILVEE